MKLKSFRVRNYKSIVDSGECRLSDHDNITVLAGQNESGKSSILQALRDYENGVINPEAIRDDESVTAIECTFDVPKNTFAEKTILQDIELPNEVRAIFANLSEIKIIKSLGANNNVFVSLGNDLVERMKEVLKKCNEEIEANNLQIKPGELVTTWDVEKTVEEVVSEIVFSTPIIIFFDDFCDLLPDRILLSDIKIGNKDAKGFQAVKNIETILGTDFSKLDDLSDGRRETTQTRFHESITADFNERWKQRIAEGNGAKVHVKYYRDGGGISYLKFYIETKKGEFLSVEKRSQGFKWFLSFYLQLKAEDKTSERLVILFDEPGLHLHSKAQLDMIKVFEELSGKNQIIYSTHSPYLIDTSKLHRLRLVVNTKDFGTTIEKITSNKIGNQKDALKPIIDALGLEIASPFSMARKNNVILEGISDFHYFQAFKKLLGKQYEIGLLPSMGSSNCHLLMELCIGWGLNWLIIFDDKGAARDYSKIKKAFFNDSDDHAQARIYRLKGCDGVEDMFTKPDLQLVNPRAEFPNTKKNSDIIQEHGGKELYARLFYEKVEAGEIALKHINEETVTKFKLVFDFIEFTLGL